jgi:hypothetical protein
LSRTAEGLKPQVSPAAERDSIFGFRSSKKSQAGNKPPPSRTKNF